MRARLAGDRNQIMKNKHIHIRDAYASENNAILDLITAAYAEYETAFTPPHWVRYRDSIAETIKEEKPVERIVAVQDETIAGSILLYASAKNILQYVSEAPADTANTDRAEVRLLGVLPEKRGQGIAEALLNECIRCAQHAGALVLGLQTNDFMHAARRLYERKGFVHDLKADIQVEGVHILGYSLSLNRR
jgi:GNAT superfamily N-acetyltransferase